MTTPLSTIPSVSPDMQEASFVRKPFTRDVLEELKMKIFEQRPMLKEILAEGETTSLYDLAKRNIYKNITVIPEKRKQHLLELFHDEVTRLIDETVAAEATEQLREYYSVTTADHQGPLGNSRFLTSNLLAAMPMMEEGHDPLLKYQIVLSCGNISFDNASFPRGFPLHLLTDNEIMTTNISFFGRTVDSRPVVYFRPYTSDSIKEMEKKVRTMQQEGSLTSEQKDTILSLISEVYNQPEVLSLTTFSEQMTRTNFYLWKKFFSKQTPQAPGLIYLGQEDFVKQLILRYHIDQDTLLHSMLFDSTYLELIKIYFNGIMGAFSEEKKAGTFLFWALPKGEKYRDQLWYREGKLITPDGRFSVEMTPEAIKQALEEKTLIPSTMLIFIVLCFYYGLRTIGSFNQTTYLTNMKHAYLATQYAYGDAKEEQLPIEISTTDLAFARAILAFIGHENGVHEPATGLDLLLYSTEETWPKMVESAKHIRLDEAIYRALPSLYRAYYPKEQQDPQLLAITEQDVEKLTGLDKKLYTIFPNK